jgi:hypothetical protein
VTAKPSLFSKEDHDHAELHRFVLSFGTGDSSRNFVWWMGDGHSGYTFVAHGSRIGVADLWRSLVSGCLQAAASRAKRESLQIQSLERLKQASVPQIMLPFLFEDASAPAAIERLAEHF